MIGGNTLDVATMLFLVFRFIVGLYTLTINVLSLLPFFGRIL